jgi:K+-sensing histidine kinase KdpD
MAWVGRYLTAVVAVGCAAGYADFGAALTGAIPFVLFPVAVAATTLRAGRGPGAAAVVLAVGLSDYLFLEPRHGLTLGAFTATLLVAYALPVVVAERTLRPVALQEQPPAEVEVQQQGHQVGGR